MVLLDLLALTAIPTAVGASEAVHQQHLLDEDAESEERQAPFYLDLRLWPKDENTKLPKEDPDGGSTPHPFTGFYLPFPANDLPHRPIPARPILGLVSTIPEDSSEPKGKRKASKPKLNWIYTDKKTRELRYGPRAKAREHIVGPWDWTEDDEQGLTLDGEECLVAVEEEEGGYGWAVYWDQDDDRLKGIGIAKEKRVLRCSLERRLVRNNGREINVE